MQKALINLLFLLFFASLSYAAFIYTPRAYGYIQSPPLEVTRTQNSSPHGAARKKYFPTTSNEHYQSPPSFYMDKLGPTRSPSHTLGRARFTLYPGSLKSNIMHLGQQFGWTRVVWEPDYDFKWVGKTRVTGTDLRHVLAKVLESYPLQGIFYQGNHVLVIAPRNIK